MPWCLFNDSLLHIYSICVAVGLIYISIHNLARMMMHGVVTIEYAIHHSHLLTAHDCIHNHHGAMIEFQLSSGVTATTDS